MQGDHSDKTESQSYCTLFATSSIDDPATTDKYGDRVGENYEISRENEIGSVVT